MIPKEHQGGSGLIIQSIFLILIQDLGVPKAYNFLL